jgi:predicted nucleic acid-binding protein
MRRVFLDTNIVIDALLERKEWMEEAFQILSLAEKGDIEVYCSSLSLATANYFMERAKMPHNVLINKMRTFCQLCPPTCVDASVVQQALGSSFSDFEDALQYYSAQTVKADVIITRNFKDFAASEIPVMTAEDYLDTVIY